MCSYMHMCTPTHFYFFLASERVFKYISFEGSSKCYDICSLYVTCCLLPPCAKCLWLIAGNLEEQGDDRD